MSLIHIENLSKYFKIRNRRQGLSSAFRDLFSGSYRTVEAVSGISFDIDAGEIVFIYALYMIAISPMQIRFHIQQGAFLEYYFRPLNMMLIHLSPLSVIGLFAITYWIWTQGVNSYTGTGS
jgi:hypothetical protein